MKKAIFIIATVSVLVLTVLSAATFANGLFPAPSLESSEGFVSFMNQMDRLNEEVSVELENSDSDYILTANGTGTTGDATGTTDPDGDPHNDEEWL